MACEDDLITCQGEKATLEGTVATLTSDKEELEGTVATLTSEKEELEGTVATLTSEKEELEGEKLALAAAADRLRERLAKKRNGEVWVAPGQPTPPNHGTFEKDDVTYLVRAAKVRLNGEIVTAEAIIESEALQNQLLELNSGVLIALNPE